MQLETPFTSIAAALPDWIGMRPRAARWMMIHQTPCNGNFAFELNLEGENERVWEAIATALGMQRDDSRIEKVPAPSTNGCPDRRPWM